MRFAFDDYLASAEYTINGFGTTFLAIIISVSVLGLIVILVVLLSQRKKPAPKSAPRSVDTIAPKVQEKK